MTKANGKLIAVPGDPKKYGSLLLQTLPAVIETEEQNEHYLAIVENLMRKGENISPEEETLLKLLVHLIEDFERRYYKPRKATPLEVLRDLMAANG
jgi:HTH-type transcriptional regulator/antitoxin HigA